MSKNLSYLYYVEYFEGIDYRNINAKKLDEKSKNILGLRFTNIPENLGNCHFDLKVKSPGLVVGIGYPHEINNKGGLKLGFSLDYTTGVPYIPGSSIKGIVREFFGIDDEDIIRKYEEKLKKNSKNKDEIKLMIENIKKRIPQKEEFIKKIVGEKYEEIRKELFSEDVFFDAFLYAENEKIFDDDYITPHKEIYKNPVPIRFMKIKEGVRFKFCFDFKENKNYKERLIKKILEVYGVGAKTSFGFGRFEEV